MPIDSGILIQLLNGITLAGNLILIAMGLAIIFGLLGIINMAHGELFMLGAYTVVTVVSASGSFWLGVALAPLVVAVIGLLMETAVLRRFYNKPLESLLATFGFSIIIRQAAKMIFGPGHQMVAMPIPDSISILGVDYPVYRLFILVLTTATIGFVLYLFYKTNFGITSRAVIENRIMSSALGVRTEKIDRSIFALGSALCGLAGALMSPLITINPDMGLDYLANSFFVVIIGGIGNLFGVIAGGLLIGGADAVISYFTVPVVTKIVVFLLAVIMIRFRPKGIFGR
jgi:urea transport system permease protein